VPFISVLVPARNEAVVIENTIRHLVSLRYPKQSLEILVVTDEKETQATEDGKAEYYQRSAGPHTQAEKRL
jgi:cellulose synthase/poly-beta-1,6-N-acetylglucosamine synthase-like glycosyltransferase